MEAEMTFPLDPPKKESPWARLGRTVAAGVRAIERAAVAMVKAVADAVATMGQMVEVWLAHRRRLRLQAEEKAPRERANLLRVAEVSPATTTLHVHHCPECYEQVPCRMDCSLEDPYDEGDLPRGSHYTCDRCRGEVVEVPVVVIGVT